MLKCLSWIFYFWFEVWIKFFLNKNSQEIRKTKKLEKNKKLKRKKIEKIKKIKNNKNKINGEKWKYKKNK